MCPWPSGFRRQPSKLERWIQLPQGTLCKTLIGDRLAVGCLTLNQETEVRTLLPELKANVHSGAVAVGSDAWL